MAALAPKRAMSATSSVTPASMAMSTTISDALSEYSHQRAGLMPRATLASYQRRGRPALRVRWSIAGEQQEGGDEPVDPEAAEAGAVVAAGAGRPGQETMR